VPYTQGKWLVTGGGNIVALELGKAHIFAEYHRAEQAAYVKWRNRNDIPLVENVVLLFEMVREAQPIVESVYLDLSEKHGDQSEITRSFFDLSERMKGVTSEIEERNRKIALGPSRDFCLAPYESLVTKTQTSFVCKASVETSCGCRW